MHPSIRKEPLSFEEIGILVGKDDPTILEIGANAGTHSTKFLTTFPRGRLFCFEPDPRAMAAWRGRVRDPRAVLVPAAIGQVDGTITFHQSGGREQSIPTGWHQSGSIRAPKEHLKRYPSITFPKTIDVTSMRLDSWCAEQKITDVDFIWADVQGAEGDLIAGAEKTLAATRFFYTEYSNHEDYEGQLTLADIQKLLPNFEIVTVFPMDVLFRRIK